MWAQDRAPPVAAAVSVFAGRTTCASERFDFLHARVEPVFAIRGVLDQAGRPVRLQQAVRAFDVAAPVARLLLVLDVVRVRVVHRVLEVIRRSRVVFLVVFRQMGQRQVSKKRGHQHGRLYSKKK